jgi:hypothetical protein
MVWDVNYMNYHYKDMFIFVCESETIFWMCSFLYEEVKEVLPLFWNPLF